MTDTEYKVNNGQITRMHVLLGLIGCAKDKEYKKDLVEQYTNGRETSTTKLTWKEAQDMISDLQRVADERVSAADLKADRKRKRILYYAHQMGYELPDGKIDMGWVNGWCVKSGYLHKALNDYTLAELSKLLWQMEQVYKSFLKGI